MLEELDEHIQSLCDELEIERAIRPGRGHARVRLRKIIHPPIREEMAYFVALHEIGHIVVGLKGTRLEREALSWRYALDKTIIPPHYSTRQRICACLVRYLHRAQVHTWKLPERGDLFWDLLRWWDDSVFRSLVEVK